MSLASRAARSRAFSTTRALRRRRQFGKVCPELREIALQHSGTAGEGFKHDGTYSRGCRGRADGADAGRRAGVGGCRHRDRRAPSRPRARRSRAGGLSSRTLEVLDQRGIVDRFLAEGQIAQVTGFAAVPAGYQRFPDPAQLRAGAEAETHRTHPRRVGRRTRRCRSTAAESWRVSCRTIPASPSSSSMACSPRASYLVGCVEAAAWSARRRASRFRWLGCDDQQHSRRGRHRRRSRRWAFTARHTASMPSAGRNHIRDGKIVFADEGPIGVMVTEKHVGALPRADARAIFAKPCSPYAEPTTALHSATWISQIHRYVAPGGGLPGGPVLSGRRCRTCAFSGGRAGLEHRCAGCRQSRLEAGPGGERNIARTPCSTAITRSGIRWRRACCARRWRRWRLQRADERTEALREIAVELLGMEEPRKRIAAEMSGLGIRYDFGEGHPLARPPHARPRPRSRRMALCVSTRFSAMRGRCCWTSGAPGSFDAARWQARVASVCRQV